MSTPLAVISPCYATDTSMAEGMIATARRVGIEPIMYGLGKQIHPHCSNLQGPDMIDEIRRFLPGQIIMCVDAFDVNFLAGPEEILRKFRLFGIPLVFSTEREGCSGNRKSQGRVHEQCIAAGGYFPQLNMGGWIGERDYALHVFAEAERLYKDNPEDPSYNYDNLYQWLVLTKAWGGPEFVLDWFCEIFQSMNQADMQFDADTKRATNITTGTNPCILHYNGDKTYAAHREMAARLLA